MKIELKNIGTVKHVEIDLDKNLLIFCGPNNTGKTYVAYALYGVYKIRSDGDLFGDYNVQRGVTNNILSDSLSNYNNIEKSVDPDFVKDTLNKKSQTISSDLGNLFASNEYSFKRSELSIILTEEEIIAKINDSNVEYNFQPVSGSGFEINKLRDSNTISIKGFVIEDGPLYGIIIKRIITDLFFGNTYIAPAERIAINIFSKELSLKRSGLLDPFSKDTKSRYSLPITECLRISEDLQQLSRYTSDYSFLAELFEDQILKGKISISHYGAMQFSPADADIKELDIHLSGSMVKSLSSLVFYFRHLAQKGDFIIIDEPELNLHPDNQIIMARILARIVNEGFKVLISTHSDYIIKELNNLVRLDSKKDDAKEIMDKYGYKKEELLDKDTLGVYLFKNNTAISLEVDELGFDVSTIEKVNSELAQISESIYFDLLDKDK